MDRRIELDFNFKGKPYIANVLIKENKEGHNYIVNLFDKQLNKEYPYSYTFIGKDNAFNLEKSMSDEQLELVNTIKQALRSHIDNNYRFDDGK